MLGGGREGGWSWKGPGGSVSVLGLHPSPPNPVPSPWLRNVSALPRDHPWGLLGPPVSRHCVCGILTPPRSPQRPTWATSFPCILPPPSPSTGHSAGRLASPTGLGTAPVSSTYSSTVSYSSVSSICEMGRLVPPPSCLYYTPPGTQSARNFSPCAPNLPLTQNPELSAHLARPCQLGPCLSGPARSHGPLPAGVFTPPL